MKTQLRKQSRKKTIHCPVAELPILIPVFSLVMLHFSTCYMLKYMSNSNGQNKCLEETMEERNLTEFKLPL